MKLIIGCDEAAYDLKTILIQHIKANHPEISIQDIGAREGERVLYPDIAYEAADKIKRGEYQRGILLCGTGIGMAICANKVEGVRAAVGHDPYSVERSRKSNNAQILCMGARVVGKELAKYLVDIWMKSEFEGGTSLEKVKRIDELEKLYRN